MHINWSHTFMTPNVEPTGAQAQWSYLARHSPRVRVGCSAKCSHGNVCAFGLPFMASIAFAILLLQSGVDMYSENSIFRTFISENT